jgi:uroporphyrinogen-III synthase
MQHAPSGRVLIVRSSITPDHDAHALRANGFHVTTDPYLDIATCEDADAPDRAHATLDALLLPATWLICASAMALRALDHLLGATAVSRDLSRAEAQGARFAAVGPTSRAALHERGVQEVLMPTRGHTASALLEALNPILPGTAVLPRSDIADGVIPATLEARGWSLVQQVLYCTRPVEEPPASVTALSSGEFDAIVLRSPSAARAVMSFTSTLPNRTRVVCGGPTTALAAKRLGFEVDAVAADSSPASIARAVLRAVDVMPAPRLG